MPRQKRIFVPNLACHVIQRGNNRQACFFDRADYEFYLECLQDACEKYRCQIHSYVLMTNHVHLLVTPSDETCLSKVMQSVGRRYVEWINTIYNRTGTLWEGRYKVSLVGSDDYVLSCYRYIELNPVRAGMVECPGEYVWSSYRHNAGLKPQLWLEPHSAYTGLGVDHQSRAEAYMALFEGADIPADWLTRKTLKEQPIGSDRFREEIEQMLNIKFNRELIGRPVADGSL